MFRWLVLAFYQLLLMAFLAVLPVVWLIGISGYAVLDALGAGNLFEVANMIFASDSLAISKATGTSFILFCITYHQLPVPLLPIGVPIIGRIDIIMAKLVGILGVLLLATGIVS